MRRASLVVFLSVLFCSAVVAAAAVGVVSMLRHGDAKEGSAQTLLANRIETARQIREALARPIPGPEALEPIKAKPANQQHAKASEKTGAALLKLSRSARNAMAQDTSRPSTSQTTYTYTHGSGGW